MISITATVDISKLDPLMRRFESRVRSATATALTRVAQSARTQIASSMGRVFDRPTPFALRAVGISPAKKDKPEARVFLKQRRQDEPQDEGSYLWPQVMGGRRRQKGFEGLLQRIYKLPQGWVAIPGKAVALDAYGNYPAPQLNRILSYLQAYERYAGRGGGGDSRNMTIERRLKLARGGTRSNPLGFELFTMMPGQTWPSGNKAQPGIYMRVFKAGARGGKAVVPLFIYARAANYTRRLDFFGTVERTKNAELQKHFDTEIARISQD